MKITKTECNYQVTECDLNFGESITLDGQNMIAVPVNATNGDMIKAMFPNIDASVSGDGDVVDVYNLGIYCQTFDLDWWNAPYKGVEE